MRYRFLMQAVLDVVKNVFSYDLFHLNLRLPDENEFSNLSYTISDLAVMTGKERCDVLREANVDKRLFPLFIRAIQHLTSSYSTGSIEDSYRLHRHVSTRVWGNLNSCPILGYPFVVSLPFHDANPQLQKNGSLTVSSVLSSTTIEDRLNGLVNQGATCYLNSLLQSLFHLSAFRSIIYNIPTKEEATAASETSNMDDGAESVISIPYALQRLFCRLQTGNGAADTTELTGSFGWSTSDGFVQHDVHELMHVLLNNLEAKLNNRLYTSTEVPGTNAIKELFQGVLENYVSVKDENYYGSTEEPFYDIQLVVKRNKDIYTSLDAFFQVEILDGKNQYCLERDGQRTYHCAEKGVRLKEIPPILLLHLTRFDFNMTMGESKVFTRWAYYNTLSLSRYMPHRPSEETHYTLYSVLVHFGSNTGYGHYYCFLRSNGVWYRFNDENVVLATLNEVFGSNFGGYIKNYWGSDVPHMNSAYLLVYIRTSLLSLLLRPIGESDLPEHVVQQLKFEEQERLRLEKEASEDHLFGRIQFLLPKELLENTSLYYGSVPSGLKISSQRVGKFYLEADLLSCCKDFIQQKKLCSDKDFSTMNLWFTTCTRPDQGVTGSPKSADSLPFLPFISSARGVDDSSFHLSARVREGMKVRDFTVGGSSFPLLLTTESTAPFIDMTLLSEKQEGEEPVYYIFHHRLYDPIHLRVIPLQSTVIRGYPSHSSISLLKMMEKCIFKLISKIDLDEDEKHLINHDYKYDKMRREKQFRRGSSFQQSEEIGVSFTNNFSQNTVKQSINKSGSSLLFNASRSTFSYTESQEDFPGTCGSSDLTPELLAPISTQPLLAGARDSDYSEGLTILSVHCEKEKQVFTPLFDWGNSWKDIEAHAGPDPSKNSNFSCNDMTKSSQAESDFSPLQNMTQDQVHLIALCSGDVLVWQKRVSPEEPNIFYKDIIEFQSFLKSQVIVTIKLNRPPECPVLAKVALSDSMTYEQLQRYVARLIGEKDYDRIRFCRHNQETAQPFVKRGAKSLHPTLHHLLPSATGASPISPILYYERCKYPVSLVENSHSLQFQLFSDSVKLISSHWILFPLNAQITIATLLRKAVEEIRKDYSRVLHIGDSLEREQWKKEIQLLTSGNYSDALSLSFLEPLRSENQAEPSSDSEAPSRSTSNPQNSTHDEPPKNPNGGGPFVRNVGREEGTGGERAPLLLALGDGSTTTRMPILGFILHHSCPEDAWKYLRLVDCWKGKIYNVYDKNHPLLLDATNSFAASAMYRIEYLPSPFSRAKSEENVGLPPSPGSLEDLWNGEENSSTTLPPPSQNTTMNSTTLRSKNSSFTPSRKYPNKLLLNIYHFCQVRGKRDPWETHGEPFSMFIEEAELPSDLMSRIAEKLSLSLVTLQDWKLVFVRMQRMVAVEPLVPIMEQWKNFCASCSSTNGGGSPVPVNSCDVNSPTPQKMPFLGLEHARKTKTGPKQEMVVIRN